MSTTYINARLRQLVVQRANHLCEYCLIDSEYTYWGCHIDHIISEKHDGSTDADNLAYACPFCNRNKGSDIGSITQNGQFVRFFNPRLDKWSEHFRLDDITITPLTDIGEATAKILGFNQVDRLLERQELQEFGCYPTQDALDLMEETMR